MTALMLAQAFMRRASVPKSQRLALSLPRRAAVRSGSCRHLYSVGQCDRPEYFVEPPFFSMNLVELPAFSCGGLGNTAGERRTRCFFGEDARLHRAFGFAHDLDARRAGH